MDLLELFFRAIGATYLLAGYLRARAVIFESIGHRAQAAFAAEPTSRNLTRYSVPSVGIVIVSSGGVALLLMSFWALPLFIAGFLTNIGWFAWAHRTPVSSVSEAEVVQAANTNMIYAVAMLGVVWLWRHGRLGSHDEPVSLGVVGITAICFAAWLLHDLSIQLDHSETFDDPALRPAPRERPVRVRIDPRVGAWPLVDIDRDRRINHLVWLPEDLAIRIADWDETFQRAHAYEQLSVPAHLENGDYSSFLEEGRAIATALTAHLGTGNVETSPFLYRRHDPA